MITFTMKYVEITMLLVTRSARITDAMAWGSAGNDLQVSFEGR